MIVSIISSVKVMDLGFTYPLPLPLSPIEQKELHFSHLRHLQTELYSFSLGHQTDNPHVVKKLHLLEYGHPNATGQFIFLWIFTNVVINLA